MTLLALCVSFSFSRYLQDIQWTDICFVPAVYDSVPNGFFYVFLCNMMMTGCLTK